MDNDNQAWTNMVSEIGADGGELFGNGFIKGTTNAIAGLPKKIPDGDQTFSLTIPIVTVLILGLAVTIVIIKRNKKK